jgi:hypothetical protein
MAENRNMERLQGGHIEMDTDQWAHRLEQGVSCRQKHEKWRLHNGKLQSMFTTC